MNTAADRTEAKEADEFVSIETLVTARREAAERGLRLALGEIELLARVLLAMGESRRALDAVRAVPEKRRRPYVRWTEADVLCALGRLPEAKAVLLQAQERDSRSRHKTLVRLCRVEYVLGDFRASAGFAQEANRFFREKWGNPCADGLFWLSSCGAGSRPYPGISVFFRAGRIALRGSGPTAPRAGAAMSRNGGPSGRSKRRATAGRPWPAIWWRSTVSSWPTAWCSA
jgi:hypothetical protein